MEIFENYFILYVHVFIFNSQEPHWCSSNCLRLVIGQSIALTVPELCVMSRTIIQGQKFTEALCRNPNSPENLGLGILAEATKDSVTEVVAIPSVIFFPGYTEMPLLVRRPFLEYFNIITSLRCTCRMPIHCEIHSKSLYCDPTMGSSLLPLTLPWRITCKSQSFYYITNIWNIRNLYLHRPAVKVAQF